MNLNLLKTMKKTILIMAAIFTATLFSCSSDDDGGTTTVVDPIVGKWNFTKFTIEGEEQTLDDCDLKSFYVFTVDSFEESLSEFNNDICETDNIDGTWVKTEEGKYTAKYNDFDDVLNFELSEDGKTLTDINTELVVNGEAQTRLFIYTKE